MPFFDIHIMGFFLNRSRSCIALSSSYMVQELRVIKFVANSSTVFCFF